MTARYNHGHGSVRGLGEASTARALSGQWLGAEWHRIFGMQTMVYMAKIRARRANGSAAAGGARDSGRAGTRPALSFQ